MATHLLDFLQCSGWFPCEFVSVGVRGIKLPEIWKNQLCEPTLRDPVTNHWVGHGRMKRELLPHVDWSMVGEAMQQLLPFKRRWLTKFVSDNDATGKTLVRWRHQADPLCP